ncbi:MAG TPA: histone deacetylase [Bryobacterales bacterium]|nr:histone deacetylase [Bryobacterales bacterium]
MLPFKLVYSNRYDLNLGQHVFPSQKYRLIHDRLLESGIASPEDFLEPTPATDEDILLVHEPGYVQRLKTGTLSYHEIIQMEIPYSRQMVEAVWLATGGTILAGRRALADGLAMNISGGFHHAFPDHGEGFCAIHDVAVAIRRLQAEKAIERALLIDCDVHQGNGTAAIFAGDNSVFTISIHQYDYYPSEKPESDIDIHLDDRTGDADYLVALSARYVPAVESFRPQLVFYLAGADPYYQDQLGGLSLTMEGLGRRDKLVIGAARRAGAGVAITLAGGYAVQVEDTVAIHCNTVAAAKEALEGASA